MEKEISYIKNYFLELLLLKSEVPVYICVVPMTSEVDWV